MAKFNLRATVIIQFITSTVNLVEETLLKCRDFSLFVIRTQKAKIAPNYYNNLNSIVEVLRK